jgi:hypothetical protein
MSDFCKKPCKHCPFRSDVKPFLHPERAEELAYHTQNPYNSFPCHKTTEYDEESEDGDMMVTEQSKECAGFLTLRAQQGIKVPEGFEPSWELCYMEPEDMVQAYEEEWENQGRK